jgi:molybdenum cofactor cytidylyltransferase
VKTGILLLAGGRSRRFGTDKRSATLTDGRTLLNSAIENVQSSGLPYIVCLGRDDMALATELQAARIACVRCPGSGGGMGATLADGVRARPPSWQGVLIALADMPWIRPTTYAAVAGSVMANRIVTPCYRGSRGHPVGFGSEFLPWLEELRGDTGAKAILDTFPTAIHRLEVDDPGIRLVVDRPSHIGTPRDPA